MRNVRIGNKLFSKKLKEERETASNTKKVSDFLRYDSKELEKTPDNIEPKTYREDITRMISDYMNPPHYYITSGSGSNPFGIVNTAPNDYTPIEYYITDNGDIAYRRRDR